MKRLWRAFGYSLSGIAAAWKDEPAFRQELILAIILTPAAFILAPSSLALALMLGSILLVLIVELLNTAVEATINRISTEIHPLAKKAKDTASAAVLLSIVNLVIIWTVVLL